MQPIDQLTFQLIPAKLGVESYHVAGCTPPAAVKTAIAAADSLLVGRVLASTTDPNYGKCAATVACTGLAKPDCCTALNPGNVKNVVDALEAWNNHQRPDGTTGCS